MNKNICLFTVAALLLLLASFKSLDENRALTLSALLLEESELPAGYSLNDKQLCKSVQAASFYKQVNMYESFLGTVKEKKYQSFESKKDKGTILYFQFEEDFDQTAFLEGLLWGGSKPSKAHPEEYLVKGDVLIIWSTDQKSELKKLSRSKIEGAKSLSE